MSATQVLSQKAQRRQRRQGAQSSPQRARTLAVSIGSVVGGILLWELIVRTFYANRTAIIAGPSQILVELVDLWRAGELQQHILVSGREVLYGMLLATAVAVVTAFVMSISRTIDAALDPWISAFFATPRIAIAPLLIIWLGLGMTSKVALVFISAVFPILLNTATGLRVVNSNLLDVGRCYGANRLRLFATVQFPSALPFFLQGLRLGYGRGLVGMVVGELLGATAGIGWLIYSSGQVLNTPRLMVGVVVLMAAGVGGNSGIKYLERKLTGWAQVGANRR